MAKPVITRGQSVNWPLFFWDDDTNTMPADTSGCVLTVYRNTMSATPTIVEVDQTLGQYQLLMSDEETKKLKAGGSWGFHIRIEYPDGTTHVSDEINCRVI